MKLGYSEAQWEWNQSLKKAELVLRGKPTGYFIEQHEAHPKMYWVIVPDTGLTDFYNYTRAKDNCIKIAINTLNKDTKSDL